MWLTYCKLMMLMLVVTVIAELWEVLGRGAADADIIGQRVSRESDIWTYLPWVWGTEGLLPADQRVPTEAGTEADALPAHHYQSVDALDSLLNSFMQPPCGRRRLRICFADVFLFFFVFWFLFFVFFRPSKIWDNRSRERLNRFSWNFYQTIGGNVVWNVVPPLGESRAAAWRMANVDDLHNLRYDSGGITRGRHARWLSYKIMSCANEFNLVAIFVSDTLTAFSALPINVNVALWLVTGWIVVKELSGFLEQMLPCRMKI